MKKPLRILHVLGGLDRGGAETMVMNLYRNIDRSKIQFDFVIHHPEKNSYVKEIEHLGGKIFSVSSYKGINHLQYVKEWQLFFKKHPEYDIVHGHVRSTASIYLKIAKEHGLITISHSHSTSNGTGVKALYQNALQAPIKNIADCFFAPSTEAGIWLFGKKVIEKNNFIIIKNSIETKKYLFNKVIRKKIREEFNFTNQTVIGHVGRFSDVKNHSFLIDIFKEYQKINENSILLLIGTGPLEKEIRNLTIKNKINKNVFFLGSRSDVNELMQAMDILIMPSKFEGIPVTLIEAQAAGLPIIASDAIAKEVKISELVEFKSIEVNPVLWAKDIDTKLVDNRKNMQKKVIESGYDVQETALKLQNFYLRLMEYK